jgi:hypothetical protein
MQPKPGKNIASRGSAPKARRKGLIVKKLDKETLVYDLERHRAYCLNSTSAVVWKHCNGNNDAHGIARLISEDVKAPVPVDVVLLGLQQLERRRLLQVPGEADSKTHRFSRREAMKWLGSTLAVSLPAIISIVAPTAANAQTIASKVSRLTCLARRVNKTGCGGNPCTSGGNCKQLFKTNFCVCQ